MSMLLAHLLLWLEYAGVVLAVLALTSWLGRKVPTPILVTCALLPVVFLLPAFVTEKTPLPLDHAMSLTPWASLPHEAPRNPNLNDVATQVLPWNKAIRLALREGSLPWRNRWSGCGTPLFANGQSAPFSPFTILALLLPIPVAFTLTAALKLFFCLLGTWLWLEELDVSAEAALFGAVCFSFSLTMTAWVFFPHTAVICLWGWALFAMELSRDPDWSVSRRAWVLMAAVFAAWSLAGHLESVMLGAAFAAFWLALRWASGDLPGAARLAGRVAGAAAAAVGLTAFSLLPQASAILASNRFVLARRPFWAGIFSWWPHGPFWTTSLYTSLFPRSMGDGISSPMIPGGAGSFPEMALAYFGIAGWAVALLVLRPGSRRRRSELALLVPVLFGWGAAAALWPFSEIAGAVPALKMMFPLRFLSWAALAGSAVAAFEIDRLRKDREHNPRAPMGLILSAGGLAVLALFTGLRFRKLHMATGGFPSQEKALAASMAVLVLLGAVGVLLLRGRPRSLDRLWPAILTAAAAIELFHQGGRLYRLEPAGWLFPETPLVRFLHSQPGPFRIAGAGTTLFPNTSVFAGVEDIRTHDPVERRDYVEFLDTACGYDPKEYFKTLKDLNAPALDLLNVRFLVSGPGSPAPGAKWNRVYAGPDGTVFENRDVLPRVFVPRGVRNGRAEARFLSESANSVVFRSSASAPAVAVASLVDDGGWRARDESGRPLEVLQADGPLLAVRLTEGEHVVTLRYLPPGLAVGAGISGATCLGLLLVLVLVCRRS
jgi:hypothetical protein